MAVCQKEMGNLDYRLRLAANQQGFGLPIPKKFCFIKKNLVIKCLCKIELSYFHHDFFNLNFLAPLTDCLAFIVEHHPLGIFS